MPRTAMSEPPKRRAEKSTLPHGFKSKAERLALSVRGELGLETHAPFDPHLLAARRGVQIIETNDLLPYGFPDAGSRHFARNSRVSAAYDVVDGVPFVLLFGRAAPTRRASDIAHELSHHELKHKPTEPFDSIGCRHWNLQQEEEATWLSGCLLVPAEGAFGALLNGLTLEEAAAQFRVSRDMFAWRAQKTGALVRLARMGRLQR